MSPTATATLTDTETRPSTSAPVLAVEFIDDDLLVEEISIDGMCGVY